MSFFRDILSEQLAEKIVAEEYGDTKHLPPHHHHGSTSSDENDEAVNAVVEYENRLKNHTQQSTKNADGSFDNPLSHTLTKEKLSVDADADFALALALQEEEEHQKQQNHHHRWEISSSSSSSSSSSLSNYNTVGEYYPSSTTSYSSSQQRLQGGNVVLITTEDRLLEQATLASLAQTTTVVNSRLLFTDKNTDEFPSLTMDEQSEKVSTNRVIPAKKHDNNKGIQEDEALYQRLKGMKGGGIVLPTSSSSTKNSTGSRSTPVIPRSPTNPWGTKSSTTMSSTSSSSSSSSSTSVPINSTSSSTVTTDSQLVDPSSASLYEGQHQLVQQFLADNYNVSSTSSSLIRPSTFPIVPDDDDTTLLNDEETNYNRIITKHNPDLCGRRNARNLERTLGESSGDLTDSRIRLNQSAISSLQRHQAKQKVKGNQSYGRVAKEDIATVQGVLDIRTRIILFKILASGRLMAIHGSIRTGKEADVFYGERWDHDLHAQLTLEEWAGPRSQIWAKLLSDPAVYEGFINNYGGGKNNDSLPNTVDDDQDIPKDEENNTDDDGNYNDDDENGEEDKANERSTMDLPPEEDDYNEGDDAEINGTIEKESTSLPVNKKRNKRKTKNETNPIRTMNPDQEKEIQQRIQLGPMTKVSSSTSSSIVHFAAPTKEGYTDVAIKIFRTTLSEFTQRRDYVIGDWRYAYHEIKRANPRKVVLAWAEKEFKNLIRIHRSGIPSPAPLFLRDHILIMSFIGTVDGAPAPQLRDATGITKSVSRLMRTYIQVITIIYTLYHWCRLIHADLSDYNLLYHKHRVYVIDVGQAVDISHPLAQDFLRQDIEHVTRFFEKKGARVLPIGTVLALVQDRNDLVPHPTLDGLRTGSRNTLAPASGSGTGRGWYASSSALSVPSEPSSECRWNGDRTVDEKEEDSGSSGRDDKDEEDNEKNKGSNGTKKIPLKNTIQRRKGTNNDTDTDIDIFDGESGPIAVEIERLLGGM